MGPEIYSVITGTGSYIPTEKVPNSYFLNHQFVDDTGEALNKTNEEIIQQLADITGIEERVYVTDDLVTSDIGYMAAQDALISSGIDKESLDYIIVAHNFGDVQADNRRSDMLPPIASKIKHKLEIKNPYTIPFDLPFGCPGWLQGMIHANYFIKSGDAKRVLVVGSEMMSRVVDPHDMDCMIFSDGAGATILEARESEEPIGIISHQTRSDTSKEAYYLHMEESYNKDYPDHHLFAKMEGRKIYEYALTYVPQVVRQSIEKAGLLVQDITIVLMHQANAKMDEAILKRLFKLYDLKDIPEHIMPMTIAKLGNNSVATIPIMLDRIMKGAMNGQQFRQGDNIILASVGAGMNINSLVYRVP